MSPTKKPAHRPLRGAEPLTERLSSMFTKDERKELQQIATEKRWTMATLVREARQSKCGIQTYLRRNNRRSYAETDNSIRC
jgi:hypothetical protein